MTFLRFRTNNLVDLSSSVFVEHRQEEKEKARHRCLKFADSGQEVFRNRGLEPRKSRSIDTTKAGDLCPDHRKTM